MQNDVVNVCAKFHNDRLRNDRALGDGKSDNNKKKNKNKKKNNVLALWRPVSESKNRLVTLYFSAGHKLPPPGPEPGLAYQIRQLCSIRRSVSTDGLHTLVHAFIASRIDYCNAVRGYPHEGMTFAP